MQLKILVWTLVYSYVHTESSVTKCTNREVYIHISMGMEDNIVTNIYTR